jgi:hypothetical protein
MKKVVLFLALAFATTIASAQFKKADKFVEGTFMYSKSTGVDAETSVRPTVVYFLTDRFAAGIFASVGKDAATKDFGIGAFGRCYFANVSKIKVFCQADLSNLTQKDIVTDVKASVFSAGLGLGANYFVGSKWAVTANVSNLVSYASQNSNSTFSVGFDGLTNPFTIAKFGVLYKF